ncbi:MAG: hypothetical protein Q7T26_03410 [Dehalococcoidia bacterium]|nr:hypothetical protein [Dehalococcoidia bacterium]
MGHKPKLRLTEMLPRPAAARAHGEEIADFHPVSDRVERRSPRQRGRNGKLYVVDITGVRAPVEVRDEETSGLLQFKENAAKLATAAEINDRFFRIRATAFLSDEGRKERLGILRARWKELYGDAMFVVDPWPSKRKLTDRR